MFQILLSTLDSVSPLSLSIFCPIAASVALGWQIALALPDDLEPLGCTIARSTGPSAQRQHRYEIAHICRGSVGGAANEAIGETEHGLSRRILAIANGGALVG